MSSVLLSAEQYVVATRYLSAAALSCSLYDHAINAAREIELVWRQQWSRLQIIVMLNTYLMEASLIIIAYAFGDLRPALDSKTCEAFVIFIGTFSTLSSGCQEFALLLHVYALWDSRKQAKYALIAGFIVCYGASVAFTLVTMIQLSGKMQYNSDLQSCVVPEKPTFLSGAWAGMVAYDVYVFVLTVLNALNRPRKKNVEIVSRLKRDGVVTFLGLFVLRMAKLLPSIFVGASGTFLMPVITWAFDTRLMYRLFLKIQKAELRAPRSWRPGCGPQTVLVSEEVEMIYI